MIVESTWPVPDETPQAQVKLWPMNSNSVTVRWHKPSSKFRAQRGWHTATELLGGVAAAGIISAPPMRHNAMPRSTDGTMMAALTPDERPPPSLCEPWSMVVLKDNYEDVSTASVRACLRPACVSLALRIIARVGAIRGGSLEPQFTTSRACMISR